MKNLKNHHFLSILKNHHFCLFWKSSIFVEIWKIFNFCQNYFGQNFSGLKKYEKEKKKKSPPWKKHLGKKKFAEICWVRISQLYPLSGHKNATHAAEFMDNKRMASFSDDKTVRTWDISTEEQIDCFEKHTVSTCFFKWQLEKYSWGNGFAKRFCLGIYIFFFLIAGLH